jgi:hypothetical protein
VTKLELKVAEWTPQDSVHTLIENLKKHGPLCVNSNLGSQAYKLPPCQLDEKINGREIFYWKKGSERNELKFNTILVIGAKASGHVYFIEPIEQDRIYVVTYQNFISNIIDLDSVKRTKAPPGIGFAAYV